MRSSFLLTLFWLLAVPALYAQTAAQQATARYRYWEAPPDSLRQVLATQRTDTARLRTLLHLLDRGLTTAERQEARALTIRLGRPEALALQRLPSAFNPSTTDPASLSAKRDSLQSAIAAFDRLGRYRSS